MLPALHKETLTALEASLADESLDAPKAKALLIRLRYQQGVEDICREWQPGKDIVLQH
jgi:molecular chaperone HscB